MCAILLNIFISLLYMFRASMCPTSAENCCIYGALVFVSLYGCCLVCWLEWNYVVCRAEFHSALHTRRSSVWSDKYQVSHSYGIFSRWWAHNCPKHVAKSNKHMKKICAPSWFYLQKIYFLIIYHWIFDRLCGLVVRVSGYRYRGLGFDSRRYHIFWVVVGLERGPLSLVRSIEELLE
jgi:hypothetical protein